MSEQPRRSTGEQWSWPTFYAGIIALGIILHLTTQLPTWTLVVIPTGLATAYLLTDRYIRRRHHDTA